MHTLLRADFLENFTCLGDACEDTCCKGWGMQVDSAMVEKYRAEAPELLEAVAASEIKSTSDLAEQSDARSGRGSAAMGGEAPTITEHIMKRDAATDYCVKFEGGWCGIHKKYGDAFLGDACYFFPRATRALGDMTLQTASLSCPEAARLALLSPNPFAARVATADRLPYSLRDYLPEGMTAEAALVLHQAFLKAAEDDSATPERILSRLHSAVLSYQELPLSEWPEILMDSTQSVGNSIEQGEAQSGVGLGARPPLKIYFDDTDLPTPESHPADPFNLLYALLGLLSASPKTSRPRLLQTLQTVQEGLGMHISDASGTSTISTEQLHRFEQMKKAWDNLIPSMGISLKRWIQAQLSLALFPFAGFGDSPANRIAIIAIRYATLKLALMAEIAVNDTLTDEAFIRITQSLSRFLDHLADPMLSLQIYTETGWLKPGRLRGLLVDN
jgi:hypothetical protein